MSKKTLVRLGPADNGVYAYAYLGNNGKVDTITKAWGCDYTALHL